MPELTFKLTQFEGPLDLLLFLISKHKLDINDIPIVELLDQYLDYMSAAADANMELAGEFLEMAARLVYIKTVSMLPRHEEAEELKKELQGKLIEYSLCKLAAERIREKYIGDAIAVRNPLRLELDNTYLNIHDKQELLDAYSGINIKNIVDLKNINEPFKRIVNRRIVSVTSKIIYVLRKLYQTGSFMMKDLYADMQDRSERVATFLAVLELTKSGRISINDDNTVLTFNRRKDNETALTVTSEE